MWFSCFLSFVVVDFVVVCVCVCVWYVIVVMRLFTSGSGLYDLIRCGSPDVQFNQTHQQRAIIPKSTGCLIDMTELSHKTNNAKHSTDEREEKRRKKNEIYTVTIAIKQRKKWTKKIMNKKQRGEKKRQHTDYLFCSVYFSYHTFAGYYRRFLFCRCESIFEAL